MLLLCCWEEEEKSILNSILALCLLALKDVVDPEANKFLKLAIATYGKKKQKRGGSKSGPRVRITRCILMREKDPMIQFVKLLSSV